MHNATTNDACPAKGEVPVIIMGDRWLLGDRSTPSLPQTLKHFESISADMGKVTSDRQVQASVRQLVEALSRLVSE